MKEKIWRVLAQILCNRNELAEKLTPFFKNLNNNNEEEVTTKINDDMLKDFDKYTANMKGGKINTKKLPKRDSKGRFVKTK